MENRAEIMKGLRQNGAFCQDIETRFACGVGDLFVCVEGFSYWAELKRWSGKGKIAPTFRAKQRSWMRDLVRAGGCALVITEKLGVFLVEVVLPDGRILPVFHDWITLKALCARLASRSWLDFVENRLFQKEV